MKSIILALSFCFRAYFSLKILACNIYGEKNNKQSLFNNLKTDVEVLSILVRAMFLVIFICNIPYMFHVGKISLLNAIQE